MSTLTIVIILALVLAGGAVLKLIGLAINLVLGIVVGALVLIVVLIWALAG